MPINEIKEIEQEQNRLAIEDTIQKDILTPQQEEEIRRAQILLEEEKNRMLARKNQKMKSSIMLTKGSAPKDKDKSKKEQEEDSNTISIAKVKNKGNTDYVLNKGKIIYATLENVVDTDIGGEITAVISQDVYSQNANNILIPRGSKIFGTYGTTFDPGSNFVNIDWNRIDLPSGNILELKAISVNNLGTKGTDGTLDMKYKEKLTKALLMSSIGVSSAYGLDRLEEFLEKDQISTQSIDLATAIRTKATNISNETGKTATEKIENICNECKLAFIDKTSEGYLSLTATCAAINLNTSGTPEDRLKSLVTSVNSIADNLIQKSKPTHTQAATKNAYQSLIDTIKDITIGDNIKQNIMIHQGKMIKIYVNQDYIIPREIVHDIKIF